MMTMLVLASCERMKIEEKDQNDVATVTQKSEKMLSVKKSGSSMPRVGRNQHGGHRLVMTANKISVQFSSDPHTMHTHNRRLGPGSAGVIA